MYIYKLLAYHSEAFFIINLLIVANHMQSSLVKRKDIFINA